jgi:hypothetical protein
VTILTRILELLHCAEPQPEPVDIAHTLDALADKADQRLDWRHSVVDLMKLLDMDSGLDARRELAEELHWPGDPSAAGAMNVWLHKEIMRRVAENGGKVPAELLQ